MHFETIWNEAESVAKSYTDLKRKEILKQCRSGLEDLADADDQKEYETALGQLLFGLCSLCAHLEDKKDIQVNSALALSNEILKQRAEILDPDPPE